MGVELGETRLKKAACPHGAPCIDSPQTVMGGILPKRAEEVELEGRDGLLDLGVRKSGNVPGGSQCLSLMERGGFTERRVIDPAPSWGKEPDGEERTHVPSGNGHLQCLGSEAGRLRRVRDEPDRGRRSGVWILPW